MIWLPDSTVEHLTAVAGWPEFTSDRYEVIEEIGRGGMGTVYSAFDTALGREVAIKIGNALPSTELQARLAREARVIARLEHPGIVPVHDCGVLADGRPFYVMKRLQGQTLRAFIETAAPPLAERLRIFERICEAVSFAHAHGIIHRDLKPENVMVGTFGEVMVMDWGIARTFDDRADPGVASAGDTAGSRPAIETNAGTVLGTPGFMAPEQSASAGQIDQRADVYALGALMFMLLTNQAPPHDSGQAIPDLDRTPATPPPLKSICRCALSRSPSDRYHSVASLAADVARFRERQAVSVHAEGPLERTMRFIRTYQTPILLVLAYIVMRALIAIFAAV
jgi:eukaryotic-like serine/threonine-protein kinase